MQPRPTARMVLTPATSADADRLVLLDADPEVMRYINGGRPTTRADAERRLRDAAGFLFVASDRSTDEFLGWFSIRQNAPAERELGYRLRRAVWGRGLATEGAVEMIELAFADPLVERVWAQTMTVNAASRHVMERCGMRFVRTFVDDWPEGPIEGSDQGDVEYELRRTDWRPLPVDHSDTPTT